MGPLPSMLLFFSFLISFAVFCEYKYKPSSLCVFICACEWTMWVGKKIKIEQCEHEVRWGQYVCGID